MTEAAGPTEFALGTHRARRSLPEAEAAGGGAPETVRLLAPAGAADGPISTVAGVAVLAAGATALGLDAELATPCAARHGGASQDAADGAAQAEIQHKGRWLQPKPVKRYEKKGRLQESWGALTASHQNFCRFCAANFAGIKADPTLAPPLPQ